MDENDVIIFNVKGVDKLYQFSTGCCGTCNKFYQRSVLCGGCAKEYKTGELSINEPKCEHYIIKECYLKYLNDVLVSLL